MPVSSIDPALPVPHTSFDVALEHDATAAIRVHGQGPRLILGHGNGLSIDAFAPFWQSLATDFETVLIDFRHHGRSSPYDPARPIGPDDVWAQLVRDFETILTGIARQLGAAPSIGVFHSMSAMTALIHAASHATPWRGLVAFEPPVPPPVGPPAAAGFAAFNRKLSERAAQRRVAFDDPQQLVDSFRRSPSFKDIDDRGLRLLAETTLRRDDASGRFDLACAREFEAAIFAMHAVDTAWDTICRVTLPVQLVTGIPADGVSLFADVQRALAQQAGFRLKELEGATHFMQIEQPAACAAIVAAFAHSLQSAARER